MKPVVYAIIPARAGSKGIKNKNIRLLKGHPLLAWSIAAAKLSKNIDRVIVSTDSMEYAEISKKYGAEVPFLRPSAIATDRAMDIGFIMHALLWFAEHNNIVPEYLVHLRPTSPFRDPQVIDQAIEKIVNTPHATSLCSATEVAHPPCKYFKLNEDETFSGLMGEEFVSLPRQVCPKAYQGNGYVDILKGQRILETGNLYGDKRLAFLTDICGDIDSENDYHTLSESHISSVLLKELDRIISF